MKLLVDIGNQRLKWRAEPLAEIGNGPGSGSFASACDSIFLDLEQQWGRLSRPQSVWISSVADDGIKPQIEHWLQKRWNLEAVWIRAQAAACGVRNGYRDPATLGSDRWAALIAARTLAPEVGSVVVDCGTAITVDALGEEGDFLGGVILPGLATMYASLQQETGEIRLPETGPGIVGEAPTVIDALARSTSEAVDKGILCAAVGGVDRALREQQLRTGSAPRGFLTGGDAVCLQHLLGGDFKLVPDLVLEGIAVLSNAELESE